MRGDGVSAIDRGVVVRAREEVEEEEVREEEAAEAESVEYFMEDVDVVDDVGTLRGLDLARYARLRTVRVVRQREVRSMVGLGACVGLRSATVAECALTSLEGAEACEGLEELYVYGNAIRSIEGMWESGGFRRLRTLWVNDNALREIDAVTSLESLRELNAARNELRVVPRARGTKRVHVFNGWMEEVDAPAKRPAWLPARVKKSNVKKVGVEHL